MELAPPGEQQGNNYFYYFFYYFINVMLSLLDVFPSTLELVSIIATTSKSLEYL